MTEKRVSQKEDVKGLTTDLRRMRKGDEERRVRKGGEATAGLFHMAMCSGLPGTECDGMQPLDDHMVTAGDLAKSNSLTDESRNHLGLRENQEREIQDCTWL